jgi:hypothetical protein
MHGDSDGPADRRVAQNESDAAKVFFGVEDPTKVNGKSL